MLIVVLLYSLRPLIRPEQAVDNDALQARIRAYKASLHELEKDAENGNIAAAELAAAREDIARAIVQSAEGLGKKQETDLKAGLWPLLLGCTLLPAAAVLIYLQLGQHRLINGTTPAGPPAAAQAPAAIEEMVAALAAQLAQRPQDVGGWMMLARAYMALGRYADALPAYEHLYSIAADNPAVLVGYAGALSMANEGNLSGRPQALVEKTLQLEPLNRTALWLAGMAAAQSGDDRAAIDFWQTLVAQSGDDEAAKAQIEQLIAQSRARLGVRAAPARQAPVPPENKRAVKVKVSLAEELRDRAAPSSTVFVVARAPGGAPLPVAVVRRQLSELPFTVTLDDAAAMAPTARLSDHASIELSARIALSGKARPQPGDMSSAWLRVDTAQAETVMLRIDRVLE